MRIPDIDFHGEAWPRHLIEAMARAWTHWLRSRLAGPASPVAMVMANHPDAVAVFFGLSTLAGPIVLLPTDARAWQTSPPVPGGTRLVLPPSSAGLAGDGERLGLVPLLLGRPSAAPENGASLEVLGGSPGVVAFTSGSTGPPRPVYRTMASLIMEGDALITALGLGPGDGVVSALPLSGIHGLVNVLVLATRLDSRIGLLERLDHREMLRLFASRRYRYWCGTPLMADILARCPVVQAPAAPAVCVTGAGRLTASVASAFHRRFGAPLRPGYGNTENGVITIHGAGRDDVDPETVGWGAPGIELSIGEEPGRGGPPGEAGRVWFRSPWYMEGYGFPPALEPREGRDGWWPTSDVGVLDHAGRLRLLGRTDDCFKTATGHLVNLAVVESALATHPAVTEAVVMAIEGRTGIVIGALIEVSGVTTTDELRTHSAARLPAWAQPQTIVIAGRLPRHERGKPDRLACRALLESARAAGAPSVRALRVAAAGVSLAVLVGGAVVATPAAEPTIRVGVIPIADTLPLYVAVDEGYFAAEGVRVELTPLAGGARIIEAIAGGSLDLGLSATLSILQAAERGLDVVIPAPAAFVRTDDGDADGLVVSVEGPVRSIGDLRGKIIAVNTVKSVNQLMFLELLARAGVSGDQVTWQEMPFPQMVAALEARRVDAALLPEPFLTVLRDRGKARVLGRTADILPGASMSAYVALRAWYEGRPRQAGAFARAYARGVAFVNQNPRGARGILVKRTGTSEAMAERMTLHLYRASLQPTDVVLLQDLARRHALLPRALDIRRLLVEPPR